MSYKDYKGPGPIPDRWLYCPRKSDHVIAEKFLAFKTPLSSQYTDQMPLECIFLPEMLFDYCKTIKLNLRLWIDLTNTERFYDRSVIKSHGAKYIKLQCRGHGETPSTEQTRSFIEIVDNFFDLNPIAIVGVHCTHGFNRTGFLIVSYLVERLDFSVEAALDVFARARSPGIYKQDYIDELYRRYEDEEDAVPAPERPQWCLEFDDSNEQKTGTLKRSHNADSKSIDVLHVNGYAKTTLNSDDERKNDSFNRSLNADAKSTDVLHVNGYTKTTFNSDDEEDEANWDNAIEPSCADTNAKSQGEKSRKRRKRELKIENATFMKGVPGVHTVQDQQRLRELQQKVQRMCNWNKSGFPGSQPVSMNRENIQLLSKMPYQVSWKADGTRYMMLIENKNQIYFIDRNNSCFQVEGLTFVKSSNLHEHLENVLLDGEMVLDKYQGQTTPRYLIYDIINLGKNNIGKEMFDPTRYKCIQKEIIEPRIRALEKGIIRRDKEPFGVRRKEFYDIQISDRLLGEKFAKILSHEPDGLIFQPSKDPYTAGVCPEVLKWKPLTMNSVDFRLQIQQESGEGILKRSIACLYVGGYANPVGQIKYTKALKDLDNKIIECTLNAQGEWEIMRVRTDKTLPNSYNTAKAVLESISQPIMKEALLNYIAKYGFKKQSTEMAPPKAATHSHTQSEQYKYSQQLQHSHATNHMKQKLKVCQEPLKPPQ